MGGPGKAPLGAARAQERLAGHTAGGRWEAGRPAPSNWGLPSAPRLPPISLLTGRGPRPVTRGSACGWPPCSPRTRLPRFPPPHNGRSIPTEPAERRDNGFLPSPRPRLRITKTDPVVTSPPPQVWGRSSSFLVGSCLPRWPRTRSPGLHTLSPHSGPDQSGRLCPATPARPPTVLSFCYYPMGSRTFISRLTPWPLLPPRGPQGSMPTTLGPPSRCWGRRGTEGGGQVLTELALEAKFLSDLIDSHHGGVPDFLQDVWQDLGGFGPETGKSTITQTWQTSTLFYINQETNPRTGLGEGSEWLITQTYSQGKRPQAHSCSRVHT